MRLTAQEPLKLVGVETTAAAVAEVHEMKMEGDVMRMRAIEALDLPQGVAVDLKPGGYHLMLQQLKAPLVKDSQVPVTLVFKDAKGAVSRLSLQLPVRATPLRRPVPGTSTWAMVRISIDALSQGRACSLVCSKHRKCSKLVPRPVCPDADSGIHPCSGEHYER
jgi:hypothetical protein